MAAYLPRRPAGCPPIANAWYAEDALDWWHRRNATPETVRHHDRRRVAAWRAAHPLDVVRIIAERRRQAG